MFLRLEDHIRSHILVCFLALVMEGALQRLLLAVKSSVSYQKVMEEMMERAFL